MSKVATLVETLKAAGHDQGGEALAVYHAAKATVSALRCKHPQDTLNGARRALKAFNVRVEFVCGYLTVTTFNRSHIWREGTLSKT